MIVEFNLNNEIYVKLDDKGYQLLADEHNKYFPESKRTADYYREKADINGYTTFQAWDFISKFGKVTTLSKSDYYNIIIKIKL
jgi:hypothetical protein